LAINGVYHTSGFGLKLQTMVGTGTELDPYDSEFWINAEKFKFTNSAQSGQAAPFTINASGVTPQVTFNGVVSFTNVTDTSSVVQSGNNVSVLTNDLGFTDDTTANSAQTTANTANSTANSAYSVADSKVLPSDVANAINTNTTTIDGAKITTGSLSVGTAEIADAAITNIKIGSVVESSNYVPGTTGWHINKTGFCEFGEGLFRGTIESSIIRSSVVVFSTQVRETEALDPFYTYPLDTSSSVGVSDSVIVNGWVYRTSAAFGFWAYNALPSGFEEPNHFRTYTVPIEVSSYSSSFTDTYVIGARLDLYTSTGTFLATMCSYSGSTSSGSWTVVQNGLTIHRDATVNAALGSAHANITISGTYNYNFSGHDGETLKVRLGVNEMAGTMDGTFTTHTG
jgi:hypothetical protein